MTESKKAVSQAEKEMEREEAAFRRAAKEMITDEFASPTPLWYRVLMFAFVALGIIWIMTFYITSYAFPVPSLGNWNIVIGVGLMMVGMIMMTRWR